MPVNRYAVIHHNGEYDEVVNIILWDGVTPYDPGLGNRLIPCEEGKDEQGHISDKYEDGKYYRKTKDGKDWELRICVAEKVAAQLAVIAAEELVDSSEDLITPEE